MSFSAMTWAASVKTSTPTQKLILLLLADRAGDNDTCFPSLQRIADDGCLSRRCVIENVKKLAANGFLFVEKRTIEREEGSVVGNMSNVYVLNVGSYPLGHSNSKYKVVNVDNHPSEPNALPSERGALGVVNDMHPNQSIESVMESKKNTEAFDQFWGLYPNKKGKGSARKSFDRAVRKVSIDKIIEALQSHRNSHDWMKDGGQFIPHPATWLNQERWDDEISANKPTDGPDLKGYGL